MYLGYVQSIPSELDLSNSAGLENWGKNKYLGFIFLKVHPKMSSEG